MKHATLDRPLFVIGAARSGTTLVAESIARHSHLAFWNEPKYVWRHGAARAPNDIRTAAEASPEVIAYIRERFAKFTISANKLRFLEKTPSNCFRIGFMHRVFPTGLFIHLVRDGRDVAASALLRWRSPPDDLAIWRRLRGMEIPLSELPAYAPDIIREAIMRRLQPRRGHIWGPRYPEIFEDAKVLDTASVCVRQWAESERAAREALDEIPRHQVLGIRYENFISDPASLLEKIFDFAGLDPEPGIIEETCRTVRPAEHDAPRPPTPDTQKIERLCLPIMRKLGITPREQLQSSQRKSVPTA